MILPKAFFITESTVKNWLKEYYKMYELKKLDVKCITGTSENILNL